jgi:hypothetical protein
MWEYGSSEQVEYSEMKLLFIGHIPSHLSPLRYALLRIYNCC